MKTKKNSYYFGKRLLQAGLVAAFTLASPLVQPAMAQASGSIFIVTEQPQLEQGESNLGGYLRGLGYDVTVNEAGNAFHGELSAEQINELESHDLVIVHRSTGSGNFSGEDVNPQWNGLNVPLLLGSAYLGRGTHWGWADAGEVRTPSINVTINAPSHPIVAGLGDDLFVRPIDIDHIGTTQVGTGTLVASVGDGLAIAVWDGSGSFNGTAGASHADRRVFFPLMRYHETGDTAGSFDDYSQNGLDMIATAVQYAMTGDAAPPPGPRITAVLPDPGESYISAEEGITIEATSEAGISEEGVVLILNGQDRSDELTLTVSNNDVSARFENLLPSRYYFAQIVITDADGLSADRELSFDTFYPEDNFTWEANDWNFQGGQFHDDPGIDFSDDRNYFDLMGVEGVDEHTISEADNDAYRLGSPVGTQPADDFPREPWASDARQDAIQYNVGWVAIGEWLNYTRTFPAGEYFVYARLASGGSGAFGAQLDRVTSDRSQTDQTTETLGTFRRSSGTGGWQNYAFVPLVDENGNLATVQLGGVDTLRVTSVEGGYNANFYMLVPADAQPPQLVDIQPQSGSLHADPVAGISFGVVSAAGVDANDIRVILNGVDRSNDLVITGDENAWDVSLGNLQLNRQYTAEITVTDVEGIANTFPYTGTPQERPMAISFATLEEVEYSGSIFLVTDQPPLEAEESGLGGFLRGLGYDVTVNEGGGDFHGELSAAQISELEGHDLVIVHRVTGSGSYSGEAVTPQWNSLNVPLVLMSSYLSRGSHWGWGAGATTGWDGTSETGMELVDSEHPIVNGLSGNMFDEPRPYDRLDSPDVGNGHLIGIVPGLGDGAALAVWDEPGFFQGTEGASHVERRIYFAMHNYHEAGEWEDISMNGMLLTSNVIEYAMTGEVTRVPEVPDVPEPGIPSPSIAWDGNNHVISWDGAGLTLERADAITGPWEAIEGATSPHTADEVDMQFFRLRQN